MPRLRSSSGRVLVSPPVIVVCAHCGKELPPSAAEGPDIEPQPFAARRPNPRLRPSAERNGGFPEVPAAQNGLRRPVRPELRNGATSGRPKTIQPLPWTDEDFSRLHDPAPPTQDAGLHAPRTGLHANGALRLAPAEPRRAIPSVRANTLYERPRARLTNGDESAARTPLPWTDEDFAQLHDPAPPALGLRRIEPPRLSTVERVAPASEPPVAAAAERPIAPIPIEPAKRTAQAPLKSDPESRWRDEDLARLDDISLEIPEPPGRPATTLLQLTPDMRVDPPGTLSSVSALARRQRSWRGDLAENWPHEKVPALRWDGNDIEGPSAPAVVRQRRPLFRSNPGLMRLSATARREWNHLAERERAFRRYSLRTRIAVLVPAVGALALLVATFDLAISPRSEGNGASDGVSVSRGGAVIRPPVPPPPRRPEPPHSGRSTSAPAVKPNTAVVLNTISAPDRRASSRGPSSARRSTVP